MKPCLLLLCLLALPALTYAQRVPNPRLKHELDSLYYVDQVYREAMFGEKKKHLVDSISAARQYSAAEAPQRLIGLMLQTDSSDMRRVRAIIQCYGYPGKKLVGTPTNEAAFYVIQHSNSIPQYLPLIKQAADQGELPFRLYAMMLDRHLMGLGKLAGLRHAGPQLQRPALPSSGPSKTRPTSTSAAKKPVLS